MRKSRFLSVELHGGKAALGVLRSVFHLSPCLRERDMMFLRKEAQDSLSRLDSIEGGLFDLKEGYSWNEGIWED